nr:hypothetical protein B0A51_03809 [Rachicladosporium sp. CCFEE 5018]
MENLAVIVPASQRLQRNPTKETVPINATSSDGHQDPAGLDPIMSTSSASTLGYNKGWRRIVRNFSPSWFSVTMGTGIVSLIFITIPFKAAWLHYLGILFFALNAALFFVALGVSGVRYTIWPEIWTVMIQDSTNSLFLGTVPMGFATLIEMWIFVCVPAWGRWAAWVAFGAWVLDCVVAVAVAVSLAVLLMSASHQRSLDSITAAQLLPIAATIVAAGTGAELASIMSDDHAFGVIITCYVLWGMATPLALSVLVMYYQRLALHKMPPREIIVSAFLPLGPLGFGGYTILYLGKMAREIFTRTASLDPIAGQVAYVLGFFVALIMWGFGLLWFSIALASLFMTARDQGVPFNMGWWGFTFPLGVYACSTILIGEELPSVFFKVLGTIFGTAVILLWIVIAAGTAKGAWTGALFHAPCLANIKKNENGKPVDPDQAEKLERTPT